MNDSPEKATAKAKAAMLDEYMRTGDLAALVTAYTNLKATASVPVKTTVETTVKTTVETTVKTNEELNLTYFGV